MKYRRIEVEFNKEIEVFDDLFRLGMRTSLFNLAQNAIYKIGWEDSVQPEYRSIDRPLFSDVPQSILNQLKYFETIQKNPRIKSLFDEYSVHKCVINLTLPCNVHFIHAHEENSKVVLYYMNLDWNEGYMGETLFFSENKKEILYSSPYTPGRVIIFDGDIPHTIRPQSFMAPIHRFTFATVLVKK